VMYCQTLGRVFKSTVDIKTQNKPTVRCEVQTDRGQTLEDCNEYSGTEPADGKV